MSRMSIDVDLHLSRVLAVRQLTDSAYILRFTRDGMSFKPGQHLTAGLPELGEHREYSIYSGTDDNFIEILVKEVENGLVSKQLRNLKEGDTVEVRGPYGMFMGKIRPDDHKEVYLIASGTGIAPFHSLIRSYPSKKFTLIHGVRSSEEGYDRDHYRKGRYILCASRDDEGNFTGRITDFLLENELDIENDVYLCGNSHMIYDAMDILHAKGFPQRQLFTEVYF